MTFIESRIGSINGFPIRKSIIRYGTLALFFLSKKKRSSKSENFNGNVKENNNKAACFAWLKPLLKLCSLVFLRLPWLGSPSVVLQRLYSSWF